MSIDLPVEPEKLDTDYLMKVLASLEKEKLRLEDECDMLGEILIRKFYKNIAETKFLGGFYKRRFKQCRLNSLSQ